MTRSAFHFHYVLLFSEHFQGNACCLFFHWYLVDSGFYPATPYIYLGFRQKVSGSNPYPVVSKPQNLNLDPDFEQPKIWIWDFGLDAL